MDPRNIDIADFSYDLPDDRIARYPLPVRDQAKLLLYQDGKINDHIFTALPELLPPGTLLIGNATKVIHARLHGRTNNDKIVEIFCLDPIDPVDYQQSFAATDTVVWKCLVGGNRKWKNGDVTLEVTVGDRTLTLRAERLERIENAFAIRFSWEEPSVSFGQLLDAAGQIPLPPYLGREPEESDRDRYQTVFAQTEGSVAAPTAGLHISEQLMEKMAERNLNWSEVILHVGAGTFKPVSAPNLAGHDMHAEYFEVDRNFLERLAAQLRSGQTIVSVGTTSTRCLESLYYLGSLARQDNIRLDQSPLLVEQWVTVDHTHHCSALEAIEALLAGMDKHRMAAYRGSTQLILTPGVPLHIIDGLITNFHQPNSTLLLIVAAITGKNWREIYDHALANDYRFLSYGDGSLLFK